MIEFKKHHHETMGIYIERIELDLVGRTEIEWAFNLEENPELAEQYRQWLATQPEENK